MLDHRAFMHDPDTMLKGLGRRGLDPQLVNELKALVEARSSAIHNVETLRHTLNNESAAVQVKAKAGDQAAVAAARERLKDLKGQIKTLEDTQTSAENKLSEILLNVPNLPHDSVPDGKNEEANHVERTIGSPKSYSFKPLEHWDLAEKLGIVDFERASKISGARFAVYRGAGARLERALITFMLDLARDHGYTEIFPPLLVKPEAMLGAAQYPKFLGESFETLDREFVLIPTSEVALVNLHSDEVIDEDKLPIRYAAYTPCFRREAGAAGRDTRGLIRNHQFNKVELVAFTTPETSVQEHERLTGHAEEVLKRLELPYRVVTLCTGDLGFASAKTYDLEVWLPGQNAYREISSCSNCTDFQARRAKIRYKPAGANTKPKLVHTLNGSGIAVGRTFVAILENYQNADGSITIPKALVPYFGADKISGPS